MSSTAKKLPAAAVEQESTRPFIRSLKKGETIFLEGDFSRSMYVIKVGLIRLFKKKGDSMIELDTVRSGQVLGELAFLDGNPRSASGEALTDCELLEISSKAFDQEIQRTPEWLKMLMKTIVGRLRSASTRIRQLETASSAYDYSNRAGTRSSNYIYLSNSDVLKILTGILLVGCRGKIRPEGIEIQEWPLNRYVSQIMGIPLSKVTSLLDILATAELVNLKADCPLLLDLQFLERLITYLNEKNLSARSDSQDLSPRSFKLMSLIAHYLPTLPKDASSGMTSVNVSAIRSLERNSEKTEPFRNADFSGLMAAGFCTPLDMKSANEVYTTVDSEHFLLNYRFQKIMMGIRAVNEQKRQMGAGSR